MTTERKPSCTGSATGPKRGKNALHRYFTSFWADSPTAGGDLGRLVDQARGRVEFWDALYREALDVAIVARNQANLHRKILFQLEMLIPVGLDRESLLIAAAELHSDLSRFFFNLAASDPDQFSRFFALALDRAEAWETLTKKLFDFTGGER